jgi:serine/threonine protein kinase
MSEQLNHDDGVPLPEISGYRLLRKLNDGGMSTVYLARQHSLGRDVAIKVMSPQALGDEISRRRFENEVRTIARLEHPHVVRIYEVGRTHEGLPYYAMPYMSRGHLGQRDYSKSERRVVEIAGMLLSVLGYAHARNIVHRDVKAENVLFDDADRPLLADFGIALRKDWGGARMTATGLAVGSTAYMAPEQARGEVVDGRADLYALGVLIWEMLTGKLPFEAPDALSMAVMHAQDPIPKLPPHLSHWQGFMNRALAKQPAQRFQDAAQMRAGIESVTQRSMMPALRDRFSRMAPVEQYARPLWATAALLAVVGIGALGAEYLSNRGLDTPMVAPVEDAAPLHRDVTEEMLAPLPESPARRPIEAARGYIAVGRLTLPVEGNAYASVLEAWNADATNADVITVSGELTRAMGKAIVENLREGNDARARELHAMATALGQQTGTVTSAEYKEMRERTEATLKGGFDDAARRFDHDAAKRFVQLARDFDLPALGKDFNRRAQAMPRPGQAVPGGGVLADTGSGAVALNRKPVTRAEYARFANASGRTSTLCRERASLLRVLAPRDWRSPGFEQKESEAVVCVSLQDAEAYAAWLSKQTGQKWRLPTAAESQLTAAGDAGRAVSLWLRDCAGTCTKRKASGASWRNKKQGQRDLLANRGYDDVGFRLVRDL